MQAAAGAGKGGDPASQEKQEEERGPEICQMARGYFRRFLGFRHTLEISAKKALGAFSGVGASQWGMFPGGGRSHIKV